VLAEAGAPRLAVRDLLVSYRVPDDFLRLAARVSPRPAERPRGVRSAPWPAMAIGTASDELTDAVVELGRALASASGSVAIVTPDALQPTIAAALGRDAEAAGRLSGEVDVLGLRTVKGLEFDAAIVVEPAAILAQRPDGGAGGLYTALTRSTRALAVLHAGALPPELQDAPELLRVERGPAVEAWLTRPSRSGR
jgi:hypothetical protein